MNEKELMNQLLAESMDVAKHWTRRQNIKCAIVFMWLTALTLYLVLAG